jgi:integrase
MLAFMGRMGNIRIGLPKKQDETKTPTQIAKQGYPMAGTRTYEILIKFVRMTFKEYGKTHPRWLNPFQGIDAPQPVDGKPRDILADDEVIDLFNADTFDDSLEEAVCAAMFWGGLRRSEIFALRPKNLDWKTPKIKVENAWKNFDSVSRELGDPKWHKKREIPFPPQLQNAIRELWKNTPNPPKDSRKSVKAEGGPFVFAFADGSIPGPSWIRARLPKWIDRAKIDTEGRNIVPHSARHSLASTLESEGVPLRYIQDLLGHSDYKTTKGYLHSIEGTIKKIGDKIGKRTTDDNDSAASDPFNDVAVDL